MDEEKRNPVTRTTFMENELLNLISNLAFREQIQPCQLRTSHVTTWELTCNQSPVGRNPCTCLALGETALDNRHYGIRLSYEVCHPSP